MWAPPGFLDALHPLSEIQRRNGSSLRLYFFRAKNARRQE
jgi:hypothetical protein